MVVSHVRFADDFDEENAYRLMELPPSVCDALTTGDEVYIVGDTTQKAVLCTPTKSFFLVREDTSNIRLLVDSCNWGQKNMLFDHELFIRGCTMYNYELAEKSMDVSQLKELLMEAPWNADSELKNTLSPNTMSEEPEQKRTKLNHFYTLEELTDRLQHSPHEVMQMLTQLRAVKVGQFWRLLDPLYMRRIISDVLDLMAEHDWDIKDTYTVEQVQSHLNLHVHQHINPTILAHCLSIYSLNDATDPVAITEFRLDPVKVAKLQAISIFEESSSKEWIVSDFMEQWSFRVPEGVSIHPSMLHGIAVCRQSTTPSDSTASDNNKLVYFPEEPLSINPKERFLEMFAFQPKWTLVQLEPYLS